MLRLFTFLVAFVLLVALAFLLTRAYYPESVDTTGEILAVLGGAAVSGATILAFIIAAFDYLKKDLKGEQTEPLQSSRLPKPTSINRY